MVVGSTMTASAPLDRASPHDHHDAPTPTPFTGTIEARADDQPSLSRSGADAISLDFFRYTPVPTIIFDSSLFIREVSNSYLDVNVSSACGHRGQILGLSLEEFFDDRESIVPAASAVRKATQAARQHREPSQAEDIRANGSAWSVRVVPIVRHGSLQYFQMEAQDITEQRCKQLELEDRLYTNETFRILVDTVKDYAIFMLNPEGNVASWNAGAQFFKGYTKDEIIGKHFSSFYSQEDKVNNKPGRELSEALRDGRVEDEGWRYRKDGSRFWANVIITPIYRGHVLLGFAKVTRDLTERRRSEEKLIAAYEESSKLKSEFLANMSHEIRTPMHGMLTALTLLLDTKLDPEQLDLARVIEESGDVLLQVINDILDYSKLASGGFSIGQDVINCTEIMRSVFRGFQKTCKHGLDLQIRLDPKLPKAAQGDSLRYRQIIQNFLSNAVKFTDTGYVHVNASLQHEEPDAYIILTEVIDTGIGVDKASSVSLFTPFTQIENSATKRFKGTGLGLSICKSLAELMDGDIGFRDNPEGQGSVFWFTVKLRKIKGGKILDGLDRDVEGLAMEPLDSSLEKINEAAQGKRILLAEDNPINTKVMLKMLAGLGFTQVDLAVNGEQAFLLSSKDPASYDIILMDINMPVLDGVGATRELRQSGVNTPIVAMTANALKGQAESYLAKGMTAYIAKPVDRALLIKVLLNCLDTDRKPD